jgi:hypothetical protein
MIFEALDDEPLAYVILTGFLNAGTPVYEEGPGYIMTADDPENWSLKRLKSEKWQLVHK